MQRKLPQFLFLSCFSFCFFTLVFHAVASAQVPTSNALNETAPLPTPTIFVLATPTPTIPPAKPQYTLISITLPTPTPTPPPKPPIIVAIDLESLFAKYSDEYHVDKEDLKRIARCESGFNSQSDTGTYAGMFQFAAQTWITNRNRMGRDPNPDLRKNAEESIRTTAFMIANGGRGAWPNC